VVVSLSSCPSGWTCELTSWIISALNENEWNETNATMYKYNVITSAETWSQETFEAGERIIWNLTDIWENTDTIGYVWVNKSYTLPSDCSDVRVWINKTEYTNSNLVHISNCQVNITWNHTIEPGEILDPEIIYSVNPVTVTEGPYIPIKCSEWGVSGLHKCVSDCPNCYSEIGFKVPWKKTVTLENTGSVDEYNIRVSVSIPRATNSENDILLYHPNSSIYPIDVIDINEGYINWTVDHISSGETQVWTIMFNTTPPNVSEFNETVGIDFTKWHNVTGGIDINYNLVWDYTYLEDPSIHIRYYDNSTGNMQEFTGDSSWGPPVSKDLNGNGFADFAQWVIPVIPSGGTKQLVIRSNIARTECEVINETILNAPITAGENVEWRWTVECRNLVDIYLTYSEDFRIPLESSSVKVDGNPVEPGFLTVPPYGPYVTLVGSLPPHGAENRTIEFITPPVTIDVSPPHFPDRFWVGNKAWLSLDITVKNWASENISETVKKIDIRYGENLTVLRDGFEVDSVSEVRGYYTLSVYNLTAYESRDYTITYQTLTADAEIEPYRRTIINSTQYLVYPIRVYSIADFPLSPLYQRFEFESYFRCDDVDFVWLTDEETYMNPRKPKKILDFECWDNDTVVKLEDLPPSTSEYYDIFVREVKPRPGISIIKVLYDLIEYLIGIVKSFIEWLISLFGI